MHNTKKRELGNRLYFSRAKKSNKRLTTTGTCTGKPKKLSFLLTFLSLYFFLAEDTQSSYKPFLKKGNKVIVFIICFFVIKSSEKLAFTFL